jgi:AraC-like DNA-binding protein
VDLRAAQAREHHRLARDEERAAIAHRERRDHLVRTLYGEGGWSYASLARAVGCSRELVAKIMRAPL